MRRNVRARMMANIGNLNIATGEKETTSRISVHTRKKRGNGRGEYCGASLLIFFFGGGGSL